MAAADRGGLQTMEDRAGAPPGRGGEAGCTPGTDSTRNPHRPSSDCHVASGRHGTRGVSGISGIPRTNIFRGFRAHCGGYHTAAGGGAAPPHPTEGLSCEEMRSRWTRGLASPTDSGCSRTVTPKHHPSQAIA